VSWKLINLSNLIPNLGYPTTEGMEVFSQGKQRFNSVPTSVSSVVKEMKKSNQPTQVLIFAKSSYG